MGGRSPGKVGVICQQILLYQNYAHMHDTQDFNYQLSYSLVIFLLISMMMILGKHSKAKSLLLWSLKGMNLGPMDNPFPRNRRPFGGLLSYP